MYSFLQGHLKNFNKLPPTVRQNKMISTTIRFKMNRITFLHQIKNPDVTRTRGEP